VLRPFIGRPQDAVEFLGPVPFMGSLHGSQAAHWDHEPERPPLTPSLSPRRTRREGGRRPGEGWSGQRFMGSLYETVFEVLRELIFR